MKRYLTSKVGLVSLLLLFLLTTFPNTSILADNNALYCIEHPEECAKEQAPVKDPATEPTIDDSQQAIVGLTAWDYIKTGFALVFVIGLLFALLKFMNRKNRLYSKSQLMKNVGGLSLGQQKSVQLIVVGDRYYLIGVGDDIRLLKEITDRAEIETLTAYYDDIDEKSPAGWIEKMYNRFTEMRKQNSAHTDNESADFSNVFNTRLEEMKEERKRQLGQLTEKERKQDE